MQIFEISDFKENAQIADLLNFDGNARIQHKSGANQFEKSNNLSIWVSDISISVWSMMASGSIIRQSMHHDMCGRHRV